MKRPASSAWPDKLAACTDRYEVQALVQGREVACSLDGSIPALTDEERQAARLRWMELAR